MLPNTFQRSFLMIFSMFFIGLTGLAQNQITIQGIIQDHYSQEPVEYANVFLLNHQNVGTISDPSGRFIFSLDSIFLTDTLTISVVGYEEYRVAILDLPQESHLIELKSTSRELEEVVIIHHEGIKNFIRKAVRKIPVNYPQENHQLESYFQEYTISDSLYAEMIEAQVTIQNEEYGPNENEAKFQLNELRKSDDLRNFPKRILQFTNSEKNSLIQLYDKNGIYNQCFSCWFVELNKEPKSLEGRLDQYYFKNFRYSMLGKDTIVIVNFENRMLGYYSSDKDEMQYMIQGEIAINKSDLAFIRIKTGNVFDKKQYSEIGYRKVNGFYYPTYITNTKRLTYEFGTRNFYNSKKMVVQRVIDQNNQLRKFKKKKLLKEDKSFRRIKHSYNPDFWTKIEIPERLKAPEALRSDLSRITTLEDQFIKNQKRKN